MQQSIKRFAGINKNNPSFLLVSDRVCRSRSHQAGVKKILEIFSPEDLPNDLEEIARSDVLWHRDPHNRQTVRTALVYEYARIDYMVLYRF